MKTQNGQLWFCGNKEGANVLVVLLHCSFHNVNHKKFQSSGKTQLSRGYLIVFFWPGDVHIFVPLSTWDVLWSLWLTFRQTNWPKYCTAVFPWSWSEKLVRVWEQDYLSLLFSVLHVHAYAGPHTQMYKATMQTIDVPLVLNTVYCILFIFETKRAFIPLWHHWGPLYCSLLAIMLMHLWTSPKENCLKQPALGDGAVWKQHAGPGRALLVQWLYFWNTTFEPVGFCGHCVSRLLYSVYFND